MLKRLFLVIAPLALAACNQGAPEDDSRSASGEVLEGTISDEMLPLDTVQSEPPFEDPKAAREVQEAAAADAPAEAGAAEGEPAEAPAEEAPAAEPPAEPAE
jgi:hypothetical protein